MNQVRDLMSRNVVTVAPDASCHDAITLMVRDRIRHLPVVDADGGLRGIVTDRDLRHQLFEPGLFSAMGAAPVERLLSAVEVREIMSAPVVSVAPDTRLDEAVRVMFERKLGSLPVVEHDRLVGILTETDVLRRVVGPNFCCPEVEAIVAS
jgi:acetoin utilization protein AcuB